MATGLLGRNQMDSFAKQMNAQQQLKRQQQQVVQPGPLRGQSETNVAPINPLADQRNMASTTPVNVNGAQTRMPTNAAVSFNNIKTESPPVGTGGGDVAGRQAAQAAGIPFIPSTGLLGGKTAQSTGVAGDGLAPGMLADDGMSIVPSKPVEDTSVLPTVNAQAYQSSNYDPALLGDPNQWNLTSEQTVQGQLDKILGLDSPIVQRARAQGLMTAASRGLENSSMAAGASEAAMIDAAMPIAQADATANLGVNRYNVDTANTFDTTNVAAQNAAREFGAQAGNRASEFNIQQQSQNDQFNVANEADKQAAATLNANKVSSANFEANVQMMRDQISSLRGMDQQSMSSMDNLVREYISGVGKINQDTNMNQLSKDFAINQLFEGTRSGIDLISSFSSNPEITNRLVSVKDDQTVQAEATAAKQQADAATAAAAQQKQAAYAAIKEGVSRYVSGKKATQGDVARGLAINDNVSGAPTWKLSELTPAKRKEYGTNPTNLDLKNGHAVKEKNVLKWK
jgi:hypothetical protein